MKLENFSVVEVGCFFGRDVCSAGECVDLLSVMIYTYHDSIVAVGIWELSDEVDSYSFPGSFGYREGLQRCFGMSLQLLPGELALAADGLGLLARLLLRGLLEVLLELHQYAPQ